METIEIVREQTLILRKALAKRLAAFSHQADDQPPTWNNNLRWHAGHLVTTVALLAYRPLGEPLPIPDQYPGWFRRDTSPLSWHGSEAYIPPFDQLLEEMISVPERIFDDFANRPVIPEFPEPLTVTIGATFRNSLEALIFSQTHDGIHAGLCFALIRAIEAK